MGAGGFPLDLVLFGMIAAFLVLRLRSILGRRTGFERPPQADPAPARTGSRAGTCDRGAGGTSRCNAHARAAGSGKSHRANLGADARHRCEVRPDRFLDGADKAFRMIVGAFAGGDRTRVPVAAGG